VLEEIDETDLKFDGVNRLLQYPEFMDIDKLRMLLSVIEDKDEFLKIFVNSDCEAVNIYIGSENTVKIMQSSSLLFKTIKAGNQIIGAIGVIGPCRMDYSKVITTIEYLADNISEINGGKNETKSLSNGKGAEKNKS
jgi:heat-inducible transcriptional repressor